MVRRKILATALMEFACFGYVIFQVFFALSRKGAKGVAGLITKYLPMLPAEKFSFLTSLPGWLFSGWWVGSFYAAVIIVFVVGYLLAIRDGENFSVRYILGSTAIFCFSLFFFPPGKHHDIFLYIFQGRMVAHYGANPYLVPPSRFAADSFYRYVGWKDFTSAYGPLWHWLEAGLFYLGGKSIITQIGVFRIFILVMHLANTWLIFRILKLTLPEKARRGMLVYGWNPLLLIYSVPGSTNDMAMIFFLLLGLWFFHRKKCLASSFFLACSALTKIFTVLYFPFHLKLIEERRDRVVSLFLAVLVAVIIWLPFYAGWQTFARMFWIGGHFHHSLLFAWQKLSSVLFPGFSWFATRAVQVVFSLGFLVLASRLWQQAKNWQNSMETIAFLLFLLLTVVLPGKTTWYISWLLPFAVLSMEERILKVALIFSLSGLLAQTIYYLFHSYETVYQITTLMVEITLPLVLAIRWKIWKSGEKRACC